LFACRESHFSAYLTLWFPLLIWWTPLCLIRQILTRRFRLYAYTGCCLPIVYLDCIVLKVRQDSRVINKSVFLALGINIEGQKELLGMWLAENEGAKFWLNVLTELKNRGLNDILIACVDGLKGF
ncbi:transposase, partial [Escherichia coli]|uniref:transposase n=2 Tax=Escherichia coli TaxID=562 RepID=UPI001FCD258F